MPTTSSTGVTFAALLSVFHSWPPELSRSSVHWPALSMRPVCQPPHPTSRLLPWRPVQTGIITESPPAAPARARQASTAAMSGTGPPSPHGYNRPPPVRHHSARQELEAAGAAAAPMTATPRFAKEPRRRRRPRFELEFKSLPGPAFFCCQVRRHCLKLSAVLSSV